MDQVARNLLDTVDGFLLGERYLILDRDPGSARHGSAARTPKPTAASGLSLNGTIRSRHSRVIESTNRSALLGGRRRTSTAPRFIAARNSRVYSGPRQRADRGRAEPGEQQRPCVQARAARWVAELLSPGGGMKAPRPSFGTGLRGRRVARSAHELHELVYGQFAGADDAAERAAVQGGVRRHGHRRPAGARQADMAALLPGGSVAQLGQGSDARATRDDWKRRQGSGSYVHVDDVVFGRQRPTLAGLRLEAERDGLSDVGERLRLILALADAARDQRAFGDDPSVLAWGQHDRELHEPTLRRQLRARQHAAVGPQACQASPAPG
jgi:hypothetical protein